MATEEPDKRTDDLRKRRGTIWGLVLIAIGFFGAIVRYVGDSGSFEFERMDLAYGNAILHLVVWTVGGLLVILWYNRPPGDDHHDLQV